jgi:hypothetical protein
MPVPAQPASLLYRTVSASCYTSDQRSGSVSIEPAVLEALRGTVLASRTKSALDPDELGITAERLDDKRAIVLDAIQRASVASANGLPSEVGSAVQRELTVQLTADIATNSILAGDMSSSRQLVQVTLPGNPEVSVRSWSGTPWMLPWTVQAGADSWVTYSVDLPRALARYVPAEPGTDLLDGARYWEDEFWKDEYVWRPVNDVMRGRAPVALAKQLNGFDEIDAAFAMKSASLRPLELSRKALFVELVSKSPRLVDTIEWFNPIEGGEPLETWRQLRESHERVSEAARRFAWLEAWKAAGGHRSIGMYRADSWLYETTYSSESLRSHYPVGLAWQHAGLPGTPSIELELIRPDHELRIELFISEDSPAALVVRSTRGDDAEPVLHWLDRKAVYFSASDPEYLLVDRQGGVERRRVPEGFQP